MRSTLLDSNTTILLSDGPWPQGLSCLPGVIPIVMSTEIITFLHFKRPGEETEALRPGPSDGIWQCSSWIMFIRPHYMFMS